MQVDMEGEAHLQTLVNIHFSCALSAADLRPRPAMLYFTFNEGGVAVFVAHDPARSEWVAQVPIFPPYQRLQDFSPEHCQRLIRKGMGLAADAEVRLHSVRSWTMQAQVATHFASPALTSFLLGDAAHRFPPSGGLGMNTGLADAHNLCWKLALVLRGSCDRKLLASYNEERHPVAWANTRLSLANYEKTKTAAAKLGVDPHHAELLLTSLRVAGNVMPAAAVKALALGGLQTGLSSLRFLRTPQLLDAGRVGSLRRMAEAGDTLPLLFPEHDLHFSYMPGAPGSRSDLAVGRRVPHVWLVLVDSQRLVSTEQLSGIACDRVLAIVHSSRASRWRAVRDLCRLQDEKAAALLEILGVEVASPTVTHTQLQTRHQRPYYSTETRSGESTVGLPASPPHSVVALESLRVGVVDVTGEWGRLAADLIVFLRPDGHVLYTADSEHASVEIFKTALTTLKVASHIAHAT